MKPMKIRTKNVKCDTMSMTGYVCKEGNRTLCNMLKPILQNVKQINFKKMTRV